MEFTAGFRLDGGGTFVAPPPPPPPIYLWGWGYNFYGQLGVGNTTNRSSPAQVGSLTTWSSISASPNGDHTMAIKTDGTMWGWGYGDQGQLGLNSNVYSISSPVQVGALTTWLTVSAGGYHTCAIKTDGTLWSWGRNKYGALGLSNTTYYSSPKQIGTLTTWLNVSAGNYYTMAIG